MGEPVEAVEGSDSEISRLFPKCRPRFSLPTTFVSEVIATTNFHHHHRHTIISTSTVTSDVNRNCVSDANDNYEVLPATIEEDVTPQRDDNSSGCDSSRMSVDSACATTSSTPASHSSSSSSSHASFATHNFPTCDKPVERNGADNDNDDLSVVSAYNDERFASTVLDSSYEESVGGRGVASPSISSSHKRAIVHAVPHSMNNLQSDAHMPSQPLTLLKREHFRLRDSRIESAGGKEMFSQSRSRPSRKRHEEGRRGHHPPHHYNHQPLIHHSHHHHHNATMQQLQKQNQQHISQIPTEYIRKVERSSSRSNSTNSNSSSSSNERRSSESKSESKDPAEEEREEISPARVGSEGAADGASTLVYETRLSGSSEVVFDDISEWVERGLTVRGVENSSLRGRIKRGSNCEPQHFIATPVTPPTPPSRSERDSEYDEEDDEEEDEEEEDEEDEDSPMRVTRIGSVPIAEYEGSPRRYGQPVRPPRPGFPRRVNNLSQDERARVLINSIEGDKKNLDSSLRSEKSHSHYKTSSEYRKSKIRLNQIQQEKAEVEPSKPSNIPDRNANGSCKENQQTFSLKTENDIDEAQINLCNSHDNNSPVKISISTITSSYASSLPHHVNTSNALGVSSPTEQPSSECISKSEVCEDYRFEDSETRKVLDEFFLESRGKTQEFFDLEYTLKRQHGNSYVGQRLAATECEEGEEQQQGDGTYVRQSNEENNQQIAEMPTENSVSENARNHLHEEEGNVELINNINNTGGNSQPSSVQENGNDHQQNCEIGISRNFTLSPETTSCDSLDVESEFSVGDAEGSIPSSGKVVNTMPVLEDGLSSGEESEMELNSDQQLFHAEEHQAVMIRQQLFIDQHIQLYQPGGTHHLYQEAKNGEITEMDESEMERERVFQRTRSLDNQLCRGELPMTSSISAINQHHPPFSAPLPISSLSPLSPSNAPNSPFSGNSLPHATSSPHASKPPHGKSPVIMPSHSPQTTLTATHSPSSSTLTLMKKQISEIEREIALKKPEGVCLRKPGAEGECSLPPKLDLHLLDPLNKKVGEPPPPPAPHPHRGNNNSNLENGSPHSTPPHTSSSTTSPSKVIGHLHSPQFTPVSAPIVAPQLLSSLGSLTSPGQVSPHMVPGHPATLELQHKPGNGVSPSRESVEAAIADIKQAIRRTKNLPLKSHPQEKQDRGPVWIPRNNRRDLPYTKRHSSPSASQTQENSPQLHHHESSPSGGSNKSQERSLHEEDDGDTDQETDRLLGQQRSDDGFLDDKNWGRIRKPVMPLSMAPNHKDVETEVSGINSNDSSPSTPSHHGSSNITPSSPQDLLSSNKFLSKKEKEYGKKKGRSKEVMVHEPAVLIEGVLFRARYLGSTQLVSEGQPTKTTRMMQAEEAVSRIKDADDDWKSVKNSKIQPTTPTSSLQPKCEISPTSVGHPSHFQSLPPPEYGVPKIENSHPVCTHSREMSPHFKNDIHLLENEATINDIEESSDDENIMENSFQEIIRQDATFIEGDVTPPLEEKLKNVLEILDRRLDEELTSYDDDNNNIDNEIDRDDEIDISPETKSLCDKQDRLLQTDPIDENIYVNVNNLSFGEETSSRSGKEESLDYLDTSLTRPSYTFLDRPMDDSEGTELVKTGSTQGNMAWIVDAKGGIGARGNVFHIRFVGSMEVEEDPVGEGGNKRVKRPRKEMVMEAVARLKAPEGEVQPSTEVDLFISTEKIMVLNTDLKEIMMDHALRTISYIADIGDLVVLMARRRVLPTDDQTDNPSQRIPKMICHVFESEEAQFIAQSIGQAFQVAYLEFLKANGIEDHSFVKEMDYQEVLNSQEIFGDELQMFAKKELQKEVVVPKMKGEILGVVVVESGWGSMVPTVVIANLSPTGAAAKCGQLNIGDQIIAINGISLVGLPLSNCQNYIKNTKYNTAVKLTVVPCPPVVEVKIRRPDTKYQLGFSVQNGVICSLLRGGIAERGGVRVGHRIIDINSQSVVAVPHEKIVNLLATSVGEIRMKTMPTSIFRLLTGQESPQYI